MEGLTRIYDCYERPTNLYLKCNYQPPSEQEIQEFEEKIHTILPNDLKQFILKYNGGHCEGLTGKFFYDDDDECMFECSAFPSWDDILEQNDIFTYTTGKYDLKFRVNEDAIVIISHPSVFSVHLFLCDIGNEEVTFKKGELWAINARNHEHVKCQNSLTDLLHTKWVIEKE